MMDLTIRIFWSPRLAPSLVFSRWIVRKQKPEYVGAPQKKFAWTVGWILALIMFLLMDLYNTYSIITGLICLVCLIFLFFESVFGICVACLLYRKYSKEEVRYCPGEVFELHERTEIQRVRKDQTSVFITFILVFVLIVLVYKHDLSFTPENLWYKLGLKK